MDPVLDGLAWLDLVTGILERTQSGKLEWKRSPSPGAFVAETNRAAVLLDRVGSSKTARYRLRFSRAGASEFTDTIMQTMGTLAEERQTDAALALLYQVVASALRPPESAAEVFAEDLLSSD